MWQVVKPLRPHPLAVGQARNFCTRRLTSVLDDRSDAPDVVADAATIASELVTNAVTAGSSAIELCLGLRPNSIYIEVADDADGAVAPAHPGTDRPEGSRPARRRRAVARMGCHRRRRHEAGVGRDRLSPRLGDGRPTRATTGHGDCASAKVGA